MKLHWRGPQYHGTENLHHHIEKNTILGQTMHKGNPTPEQYIGWLSFKARFFDGVDRYIPPSCRRGERYRADIVAMGAKPVTLDAAERHLEWLIQPGLSEPEAERRRTGTAYVCVGSVFGSLEIRSRMMRAGMQYPMAALDFSERETELAYLNQLRHRADCIHEAMVTFRRMTECCEQIIEIYGG